MRGRELLIIHGIYLTFLQKVARQKHIILLFNIIIENIFSTLFGIEKKLSKAQCSLRNVPHQAARARGSLAALGLSSNPNFHRELNITLFPTTNIYLTKCFDANQNTEDAKSFPGLEKFITAVDFHFHLTLPATFSQLGNVLATPL